MNLLYSRFFSLIEIEAQHISRSQAVIIKIFGDLLLPLCVISLAVPDLELYDILTAQVIDNDICALLVSGLSLNIIIACAVDNGLQIENKSSRPSFSLNLSVRGPYTW